MNPLTEEELNELAQLVPNVTIEWPYEGEVSGRVWVSRRIPGGLDEGDVVLRAQELIGPPDGRSVTRGWRSRYRKARPDVLRYLKFIDAIYPASEGKKFPH